MAALYAYGNAAGLTAALQQAFTPASALSFLVFVLLYMPCVAAFSTIRRELGGWRAGLAAMAGQTAAAYVAAFFVYRIALLFGPYKPEQALFAGIHKEAGKSVDFSDCVKKNP